MMFENTSVRVISLILYIIVMAISYLIIRWRLRRVEAIAREAVMKALKRVEEIVQELARLRVQHVRDEDHIRILESELAKAAGQTISLLDDRKWRRGNTTLH